MKGRAFGVGTILSSLVALLRRTLIRLLVSTGERRQIQGLEVVDISRDGPTDLRFTKIAEALELIGSFDPPRLEQLRGELQQIVIHTGTGVQYLAELNACLIDGGFVLRQPPARIAMSLVHESTHARLHRAGVAYNSETRAKIELECVEAEIAFGSRIPGNEGLVNMVRQHLAQPWWTEEQLHDRRLAQLRASGWPRWFVNWYGRAWRRSDRSSDRVTK